MLHLSAAATTGPRILFLPNWPVASTPDGRQSPDHFPMDGRYWFFRHFERLPRVDVLDIDVWPKPSLERKILHFYLGQGLAAVRRAADYDLVFAFGAQSAVAFLAAARLSRRPHPPVLVDDAGCLNGGRPDRPISFGGTRWAMQEATRIVWHSTASVELCRNRCPELEAKGEFLHFGISLPDVDFVPSTDGGYAICAGNSPREWTGLARAWHSEADFPLLLLGAPVRQSELPSNVVALPRVDFPAYVRLLAEARVVLLPLPDGWASWGQMTLLQAMALGKSVVVSNVRPVRDYVAEGCLTVPGADHRAMARAAVRLRHDHAGRVRLGEQARSAVEHSFNEVTMARRFESIIAAILG